MCNDCSHATSVLKDGGGIRRVRDNTLARIATGHEIDTHSEVNRTFQSLGGGAGQIRNTVRLAFDTAAARLN